MLKERVVKRDVLSQLGFRFNQRSGGAAAEKVERASAPFSDAMMGVGWWCAEQSWREPLCGVPLLLFSFWMDKTNFPC